MTDGHLNKCKECTKADTRKRGAEKADWIREQKREYRAKPERARRINELTREYRAKNPDKARAHRLVAYELREGRLVRQPCEICGISGAGINAHHDDYAKPLEVRWLCSKHHREWHNKNGG